jgi:hypothetical protein
MLGIA